MIEQCWCGALGEHATHWYDNPEAATADLEFFRAAREANRHRKPWSEAPPDSTRAERHAKHTTAKKVINEINRARIAVGKMLGVVPENVEPQYRAYIATALGMYDEVPGPEGQVAPMAPLARHDVYAGGTVATGTDLETGETIIAPKPEDE